MGLLCLYLCWYHSIAGEIVAGKVLIWALACSPETYSCSEVSVHNIWLSWVSPTPTAGMLTSYLVAREIDYATPPDPI
jgi:hypothetical protein